MTSEELMAAKQDLQSRLQSIQEHLIHQVVFSGFPIATAVRHMREETLQLIREIATQMHDDAYDEWDAAERFSNFTKLL